MAARKSELIITCNAKGVQNVMRFMEERLKGIKQILQTLNEQGSKTGWTDQMRKDFKELTDEAAGIDTIMKRNEQTMIKYGQVMKDLAGSKMKDLKSALREATQALNKMSEKSPGREKLINDIKRIKDQISGTSGLTMSFSQAQKQLKNLDGTSMDKLKQGLAAIKAQLDNPNIGNKWRKSLEQMQAQYQAAMAVRTAPTVSNKPVYTMNTAQLKAEQAALSSAFAATTGVKGYENQAANYAARLKEVNQQLKQMAEYEKMAADGAKQLQATQEAAKVVQQVYRGQEVSLEKLNAAYQTLQARAQQFAGVNPAKAQAATRQMEMLRQRIQQVNSTMLSEKDIQDRIAHSGKYTVQQLQQAYNQLQAKLQTLHTNDIAAIKATQKQMKLLQQDINRATGQVSGFAKAWQTAKQNIMMYVGVFAIVNKIKTTISDLVTKNKELSDSMANIRKVSQWAYADVEKLTNNLAKIDTRNTINTLQNLAYQGAKLGIGQYGVEGLTGFVRAAEQVQTALGEDLGEEALPALAKLTEVMGLIPKFGVEEAMQKAGSAIYQLGATSTATGANIVEFSKRLMGLANVSGVTADQLLGLGSAADSMALMPEVAATAFNKLFNSIHGNTENIAKAVGIAKEELQDLLYEGRTMDALVKVFEKMQKMSMKELEGRGVFKELGSDGTRLTNVMITMANKVDMLKSHLDVANQSFSEGRAVINEYMIQQETAAAYFERASNIWTKAFINPEGVDIVKQLAQEWYNVSYEMTHSASTMSSIKLTLESLATVVRMLITYLPTLIQLMMAYGVGSALQGIYLQYKAIYSAATLAGTATARFNALLKTNAMALAITAALMLAAKLYEVAEASKAAAAEEEKRQRIFTDAAAEALSVYNEQAKSLDKYREALKKSNVSEEERNEIIRQFKQEFGSYLEKLGIEINTYKDMENALHRVNKELKDKAYYETGQKLRESYVGDAKSAQTNALSQFMQAAQKYDLPTKLMEDIVEGKVKNIEEAMQRVADYQMSKLPAGTKVFDATKFGMGGWQDVREEENKGFGAKVSDFLFGNKTPKATKETEDIYHAINNLVTATQEVNTRENQVTQFMDQYAENYSPQISVDGAILNLKRLKELNEDKLNEGLNILRDAWKEMSENERKADAQPGGKGIGNAIDAYSKQIRAMRGEGYTPPPSAEELRKQEAERKKALRAEMKDEQQQAKAIIDNVKNYYQRQLNAITEMANLGTIDKTTQEQMTDGMTQRMNTALANVRKAIGGTENDWEEFKKSMREDLYEPLNEQGDNFSTELLDKILDNNLVKLREMIQVLSKELNQQGSVLLDQILRKATENEGKNTTQANKLMRAREKELLERNYTGKVDLDYQNTMEQFGIGGITTEQSRYIRDWSQKDDTQNIKKFFDDRTKLWQQGFEQARKNIIDLYRIDIEKEGGVNDLMELLYGKDYKNTLQGSALEGLLNMDASQWRIYYMKLIEYNDQWVDAQKKAYDENKKRQDYLFSNRPDVLSIDATTQQLSQLEQQRNLFGQDATFGRQMGMVDTISNDPELMRYDLLQARAEMYYNKMYELRQQDLISEQQLKDAREQMTQAQINMQQKLMEAIQSRTQTIQNAIQPITDFAEQAGMKLGDMMFNMESQSMTWNQIWKNMLLAMGKSIIQMGQQYAIQKLQRSLFNKQVEADEEMHQTLLTAIAIGGAIARTTGELQIENGALVAKKVINGQEVTEEISLATILTALGISKGAAKTIGALGWLGIPLIAVISSLLMGLLTSALSTAGAESAGSSSSTAATPKTKLVSGMLTYDKGNVDRFAGRRKLYDDGETQVYGRRRYLGEDGKVYTATAEPAPKDGLITHPIATTVQGQPALVAENGPEIVIGRETTKAIMMNEPELIRYLANYQQHGGSQGYSTARGLAAYDSGNVRSTSGRSQDENVQSSMFNVQSSDISPQASDAAAERQALINRLDRSDALMEQVLYYLQNPIAPEIAMFDTGGKKGLRSKMKEADRFMARYDG